VKYMANGYRGVSLPKELVDDVEFFTKAHKSWPSVAQFISEAVRLRLEDLKKGE